MRGPRVGTRQPRRHDGRARCDDRAFTGLINARSATIRLGKEAFYAQVEQPIARGYAVTGEAMACNMLLDDASEGIDAFLGSTRLRGRALIIQKSRFATTVIIRDALPSVGWRRRYEVQSRRHPHDYSL